VEPHFFDWPTNLVANNTTAFNFILSKEVDIEKRKVYDVFMMFGDVGGLIDFQMLLLSAFFGHFSSKMMLSSLVSTLFHVSDGDPSRQTPL